MAASENDCVKHAAQARKEHRSRTPWIAMAFMVTRQFISPGIAAIEASQTPPHY